MIKIEWNLFFPVNENIQAHVFFGSWDWGLNGKMPLWEGYRHGYFLKQQQEEEWAVF